MKPNKDDIVTLNIERLGSSGEGVGAIDGFTTFVDGALPGESVKAQITVAKSNYAKGELLEILESSPDRVDPICPIFARCGGCQIMHLKYKRQLELKRQRVVDALERIGHFSGIEVESCLGSPHDLHYRNKIQLPVVPREDGLEIGLYAKRSHNVIGVETCYIHNPVGEKVYVELRGRIKESNIKAYNEKNGNGELRHILIRTAVNTGQVLITFVTNGDASKELIQISEEIVAKHPEIKSVIQNCNRRRDNVILGREWKTLVGADSIEESICGLTFKVSPASFFQVNPQQAENLYQHVIAQVQDKNDVVLDAYCGVGTMSLMLAERAKKVYGIECIPEAIEDAKQNAERNGISNCEFVCGDVENKIHLIPDPDVVILNPPRKGCDKIVLDAIQSKRIVYVSCDPATLARDLAILNEKGYTIIQVQPFDMFPQTSHVETVVTLESTD